MILAAKELDVMVGLAEMEIEVSAALRAFQPPSKFVGFIADGRCLAAGSDFQSLYLFPSSPVNDCLVNIQEHGPVLFRVFNRYRQMSCAARCLGVVQYTLFMFMFPVLF